MKSLIAFILFGTVLLTACGEGSASSSDAPDTSADADDSVNDTSSAESEDTRTPETTESEADETAERKIRMDVNGEEVIITLYDTPTASALYELLPMELDFSDYNNTEKIAYPNEKLPTEGEPDGCDPDVGDLCLYAPWGNLCVFYKGFGYSRSLIKLGRVESGMDVLSGMTENFTVTIERIEN